MAGLGAHRPVPFWLKWFQYCFVWQCTWAVVMAHQSCYVCSRSVVLWGSSVSVRCRPHWQIPNALITMSNGCFRTTSCHTWLKTIEFPFQILNKFWKQHKTLKFVEYVGFANVFQDDTKGSPACGHGSNQKQNRQGMLAAKMENLRFHDFLLIKSRGNSRVWNTTCEDYDLEH